MATTKRSGETKKIAAALAGKILKSGPSQKGAKIIALVGDLGAGKTTFAQGFAKALGIKSRMTSPTFLIFRNYGIKKSGFHTFFHMDAYRINSAKELAPLGFKEALKEPGHIFLIEWADRIKKLLPKDSIWVHLRHGRKTSERTIAYRRQRPSS